ncbi:MAG: methionyl-tRNA formyltransferase [Bacteroidota bacterium]
MRIIFIGTVEFSKQALSKLVEMNENIVSVITKEKSNFNTDYSNLAEFCISHSLEYHFVSNINDEQTLTYIQSKQPDIIFCFGWSQLIKIELLKIPRMGVIGFHPALLPQNRGRHPIIWALALGLNETGSTFFVMDEGADSGDILSQRRITINYTDDAASLYEKITATALTQIEEFVPALKSGTFQTFKQDSAQANYWRKRTQKDGEIDWRMTSRSIYNLVRALTKPYIGAHFVYHGNPVKVWQVEEVKTNSYLNLEPGKVIEVYRDHSILVKTGENCIRVLRHELEESISEGEYL